MKINYGCGETKLKDFVNVDIEPNVNPDLVCDLRHQPFPYEENSVDLIHCIHNLEHIELKYWPQIMKEFWRVLKPGAELRFAYPEFETCAKNFVENFQGKRDFWRATLYGRQLYPGDYHVVPMRTSEVLACLDSQGFGEFKYGPEPNEPYNTFLVTKKLGPALSREDVLRKEIFHK